MLMENLAKTVESVSQEGSGSDAGDNSTESTAACSQGNTGCDSDSNTRLSSRLWEVS